MSTTEPPAGLETEFTAAELATSLRRSERWLKNQMYAAERAGSPIDHNRHGNKITFTRAQAEAFRERGRVQPAQQSITTGRGKRT